jgi:periplasmic protein TonB
MALGTAKKKSEKQWLAPGIVLAVFAVLIGVLVKMVLWDGGAAPKKQIQVITLIKPPPEVKEKLPEPEAPKEAPKQAMENPAEAPTPQNNQSPDNSDDAPAAGDNLAVDGDGGAGDNAFGLGAKKGGRGITLGGGGGGMNRLNLLAKFGRYVQKVQEEVRAQVKRQLEQTGGIPKGKYHTLVRITLNSKGTVASYQITSSSGEEKIDQAVREALAAIRISEPPPEGMPTGMTIRIASQG